MYTVHDDLNLVRWLHTHAGQLHAALVTAGRDDLVDALVDALGTTRAAVAERAREALAQLGEPEPAA